MKVLTCTGYYSTGSSAITDLLSEYCSCCCRHDDYELRFIYDPDGISDLEFHLVDNHNRHNSGHALKRYLKLAKFYKGNLIAKKNEAYFDGHWMEYTNEYINNLVELEYQGTWLYDYLDRGVSFHYFNSLLRKICGKDLLSKEKTYCSYPSREYFIEQTKSYLSNLFSVINKTDLPFLVVDQLLPPSDINRYIKYFDDIKVIIVERDPRDIFFLEKYYRKSKVLPTDVTLFCKWYKYTRRHRKFENVDSDYSMLINFEDLLYNYNESLLRIEKFYGLDSCDHIKPKSMLVPEKSINNTQIWKRTKLSDKQLYEVNYIESSLQEYLYSFPDSEIDIVKGAKIE